MRPFWTSWATKKSRSDGCETNKPTHYFLYIFFPPFGGLWGWKRAQGRVNRYFMEQSGRAMSFCGSINLENIFFPERKFQENKKATPSDTLSVPLKISRLVWLYGAAIRIWTGDLILTNAKFLIFLIFFSCLRVFSLWENCFPTLLKRKISGHSGPVCGCSCGQ